MYQPVGNRWIAKTFKFVKLSFAITLAVVAFVSPSFAVMLDSSYARVVISNKESDHCLVPQSALTGNSNILVTKDANQKYQARVYFHIPDQESDKTKLVSSEFFVFEKYQGVIKNKSTLFEFSRITKTSYVDFSFELKKIRFSEFDKVVSLPILVKFNTSNKTYEYTSQLYLVNQQAPIMIVDQNSSCYQSAKPKVVSERFTNPVMNIPQDIEYKETVSELDEKMLSGAHGLVELGYYPKFSEDSGMIGPFPLAGAHFYKANEYIEAYGKSLSIRYRFHLAPAMEGYIVAQDTYRISKARLGNFDQCGRLDWDNYSAKWDLLHKETLTSHTLLQLEPQVAGSLEAIEQKMDSYPMVNTCKEKF